MADLRVLHVITGLGTGGAEMMLLKLVSEQPAGGIEHAVVSLDRDGTLAPRFRKAGVEVTSLDVRPSRPNPLAVLALRRKVREFGAHTVQGWMYHGNFAALIAAAGIRSSLPVAWNIRQTLYDLGNEKWLTARLIRMGAAFSRSPVAIVYNSETSAVQHEALGYSAAQRLVIPNGFDTRAFAPDPAIRAATRLELGLRDSDLVIGLVGRFHPMKDHAGFVTAAATLANALPNARFLIVGRGVTRPEAGVLGAIDNAGISGRTLVLEERADMVAVFNAVDVACSSSAWGEGFSNVLGEAMACGVPCVATDVGDAREIIGATGAVVPARDSAALAAALQRMLSGDRSALGASARKRVMERFSIGSIAARYADLYRRIVDGSPRTASRSGRRTAG